MVCVFLFSLSLIFSSILLANGQCTTDGCKSCFSESHESFEDKFIEHDEKLNHVYNDLSSRLQEIQTADKVLVMDMEEQSERLENIFANISSRLDGICLAPKSLDRSLANEEMLDHNLQKNLSFEFTKTGERIESAVENLSWQFDQQLNYTRQDLSLRLEKVEGLLKKLNYSQQREQVDIEKNSLRLEKLEGLLKELKYSQEREQVDIEKNSLRLERVEGLLKVLNYSQEREQVDIETNSHRLERLEGLLKELNYSQEREQVDVEMNSLRLEGLEGLLKELNYSREKANEDIEKKLETVFHSLSSKHDEILQQLKSKDYCQEKSEVCDCADIKASGFTTSEVYRIYVIDANKRHYANAYCDMTTANNSWIVFQRRKDGSENFYRGWRDYEKGFGDPNGEYWLGNEFLHILTSKRRYRLRVDMEDFEGGKRYAEYLGFNIKSSEYNYTLTVGNFSGNAGDALTSHSNMKFSTFDSDTINNCAKVFHGAWWYHACKASNLNGRYLRGSYSSYYADGINWAHWRGHYYSLKTTEMKLAPLN